MSPLNLSFLFFFFFTSFRYDERDGLEIYTISTDVVGD